MITISPCKDSDYPALVSIWERSVRATHSFLSEQDIVDIREALIPLYFKEVCLYGIYEDGVLAGFIGLADRSIEMLFIDSDRFGKGLGSRLLDFAKSKGADSVDVNEQNPQALSFYLSYGFHQVSRDEYDSDGRHFPILHLSL